MDAHDFDEAMGDANEMAAVLGVMGGPGFMGGGLAPGLSQFLGGPPPPRPPPSQDDGMDRRITALARWTGEPFALGLFAGVLMTPGSWQHERPTFEVLDLVHRVEENGIRSLGLVQSAGVLVGLAIDRILGLYYWWWKFMSRPMAFLTGFVVAWFYGLPKLAAAKNYALWSAVASLVVCRDAPKSLRVLAVAYEAYYLVGPYLGGETSLLTFWMGSLFGACLFPLILVNTIAPACWMNSFNPMAVEQMLFRLPDRVRMPVRALVAFTIILLIVTPANHSMIGLGFAFAPSWVLSRFSPVSGRIAHLVFRLSEIYDKTSLLQQVGVAFWASPHYAGHNTWESAVAKMDRQSMWRRYRRTVRLEGKKEAWRSRRRELEVLMEQGLMDEIPAEVGDVVLGYLGFPAGAQAPGADRDERDYRYFKRRRPHNPMSLFEAGAYGDGGGLMLMLMLGLAMFRGPAMFHGPGMH